MKRFRPLFTFFFTLAFATVAFAAETAWEMADSEQYGEKAMGMVGRGLLNVGTCPLDTIVHTVEGTQEGPPVIGTLGGLGSGLGCTLLRALSGVLDVATFWVPGFHGAPVSESYSDCLDFGGKETVVGEPVDYGTPAVDARAPADDQAKKHDPMAYVKK